MFNVVRSPPFRAGRAQGPTVGNAVPGCLGGVDAKEPPWALAARTSVVQAPAVPGCKVSDAGSRSPAPATPIGARSSCIGGPGPKSPAAGSWFPAPATPIGGRDSRFGARKSTPLLGKRGPSLLSMPPLGELSARRRGPWSPRGGPISPERGSIFSERGGVSLLMGIRPAGGGDPSLGSGGSMSREQGTHRPEEGTNFVGPQGRTGYSPRTTSARGPLESGGARGRARCRRRMAET